MIVSPSNPKIKRIRQCISSNASTRKKTNAYVLEAPKAIQDLLKLAPDQIEFLAVSAELSLDGWRIPPSVSVIQVAESLFKTLSHVKTPQGMMAILRRPDITFDDRATQLTSAVIVDGVSDPTNLGAIARNAVAFGIGGLFVTTGTADLFHPDCVRASAGLVPYIPLFRCTADNFSVLLSKGFTPVRLDISGTPLQTSTLPARPLFILGSEGSGIQSDFLKSSGQSVRIDMAPAVDSINVAATSAVIFHSFHRIRSVQGG